MKVSVTPREFYRSLEHDKKLQLAARLGVSYTRLSGGYFAKRIEKRPTLSRPRLAEVQAALNELGGNFSLNDIVDHFFIKE
ncbi:hypothetical protein [Bowmanella sp. JS7-9]|uniref:XRE family transcriptional regulator n=1 Tax=Pseudobowmanella zhangzhouensis TaxID=1537679 RepID=A0ABW1XLM7_9ALTE|nr:hypothetical protein [Bowmanella sp. JS7-9]TBX21946.1 hypothetical protein TK45_10695 [Bowmanella sp. JS7-9]